MTLPEVLLWQHLRQRPDGLKFRRQHAAGPYVLDFYCEEARLCIEVDGAAHESDVAADNDARRDAWLMDAGVETLRVAAREVLGNMDGVIQLIILRCRARPLHHSASPNGPPPLQGGLK